MRQVGEHRGAGVDQQVDHEEQHAAHDRTERVEPARLRGDREVPLADDRDPHDRESRQHEQHDDPPTLGHRRVRHPQEGAEAVRAQDQRRGEAGRHDPGEHLALTEEPERDRVQRELGHQDQRDQHRVGDATDPRSARLLRVSRPTRRDEVRPFGAGAARASSSRLASTLPAERLRARARRRRSSR